MTVTRSAEAVVIDVPLERPDPIDSVVALLIADGPSVTEPPTISAAHEIFVDALEVTITPYRSDVEIRYTLDGTLPRAKYEVARGPIRITESCTIVAQQYRAGNPVSGAARATFTKVTPRPAVDASGATAGVQFEYFEGEWSQLPDFDQLTPLEAGIVADFEFSPRRQAERFGFRYRGLITVPRDGVYTFYTLSDDGSRLYIGDQLVVDNDGLHSAQEVSGVLALAAGAHPITVTFFERTGGDMLEVCYEGPDIEKQRVPAAALSNAPAPGSLRPTRRQLAWQEVELIAFIHFGMNTFTDQEWGDGTEDPSLFNPTELAARQWVQVCKDAGIEQIIITAKHHDGFCLWPSDYTEHSVKHSPWRDGKGDVVRELADACRDAGLKMGIYLSPWDRHEPCYGDSPRYNEHYTQQLTELLTNYGPISEVWFDGACGEGPNGRKQVYDWPAYIEVVRRLQSEAVIFSDAGPDVRWVGNEHGFAGDTNWSTLRRGEFEPGTPKYRQLTEGHVDGTHWVAGRMRRLHPARLVLPRQRRWQDQVRRAACGTSTTSLSAATASCC